MDLPHYHGIGVTASAGAAREARAGTALNGAADPSDADGTKEVTGA
jgi:hypothetical protein